MDEKDKRIHELELENMALKAEILKLKRELGELKRRLGLNNSNSSKAPSSDGLQKKTVSMRELMPELRMIKLQQKVSGCFRTFKGLNLLLPYDLLFLPSENKMAASLMD